MNVSASISPQIKASGGPKAHRDRHTQQHSMGASGLTSSASGSQQHYVKVTGAAGHHRRQVTLQYDHSNPIQAQLMAQ